MLAIANPWASASSYLSSQSLSDSRCNLHATPRLWGEAGALEGIHAGGRWGPTARRRRRFFRDFFSFFARCFTCFQGIRRSCGHAITPCDSLLALLTVPCCTIDHPHSSGLSIKHSVTTCSYGQ